MAPRVEAAHVSTREETVCEVFAQFWVDTWYDDSQLAEFARILDRTELPDRSIARIVKRDVCGGLAYETLTAFLSVGMAMPDWFFPEDEARRMVTSFRRRRVWCYLNPVWWVGYCASRLFVGSHLRHLRARVAERRAVAAV